MKKLIAVLTMLALMGVPIMALDLPAFVAGKVYVGNALLADKVVTVTNLDSGRVFTATTNGAGEYMAIMTGYVYNGQSLKAETNGVTQLLTYKGGPLTANFDLSSVFTNCPVIEKEVPVEVIKEVPVEVIREVNVEVIKNVYVCSDGTARDTNDCPTIPTIPTNDINYAIVIIVGIITFVAGSGLKIYRKLDGSVAVQHKHKNATGYHDPNIVHKVQPHKKGEIVPKYSETKGTDGYYKYLG